MEIRTTKPEKGNKFYIRKANGGYNDCIKGNPTDKDCDVLSNCFSGETKYITNNGLKTFAETVNTIQQVLNETGKFVPAEIKEFGTQQLYKIVFNNGETVYTTANHRWIVENTSNYNGKKYCNRKIKTTLELKKWDNIPYNYYSGNNLLDKDGIVHGIIFGDGRKNKNCKTYNVTLYGNKEELKKYLPKHIYSDVNLKEVPSIYESEEYLRGFIAGLLATDGCITKNTFKISNINFENLKQIENICYKIGIGIGGIYKEKRDIKIGKYEYKEHVIYNLTLKRKNIEKLLLKTSDLEKISQEFKDIKYTRIKNIEPTNRYETVYCAVEPLTHTITLEKNILTGQCVGYAEGRFNEIIGSMKYTGLNCNAENFIERAEKKGLKISKVPTLGGIMVWQKGSTLKESDGAGHVAIVERIDNDNQIYTSESAYGSKAFYNTLRTNDNGRWGQKSGYTFRGCIINPSIKETSLDTPNKPVEKQTFKVGDLVVPTKLVNYKGTKLKQYDKYYTITSIASNKAILSANRKGKMVVWATMNTKNIKLYK